MHNWNGVLAIKLWKHSRPTFWLGFEGPNPLVAHVAAPIFRLKRAQEIEKWGWCPQFIIDNQKMIFSWYSWHNFIGTFGQIFYSGFTKICDQILEFAFQIFFCDPNQKSVHTISRIWTLKPKRLTLEIQVQQNPDLPQPYLPQTSINTVVIFFLAF